MVLDDGKEEVEAVWAEVGDLIDRTARTARRRIADAEAIGRQDLPKPPPLAKTPAAAAACSSGYSLDRKPAAPVAPAAVGSSYCLARSEKAAGAGARGQLSRTSLGDLVMERYGRERGGRSHGFPGVRETAAPRPVGPGEVGRYRLSAELTGPGSQPTRHSVHLPAARS
mgnify:CR=1 FL=1